MIRGVVINVLMLFGLYALFWIPVDFLVGVILIDLLGCQGIICVIPANAMAILFPAIFAGIGVVLINKFWASLGSES